VKRVLFWIWQAPQNIAGFVISRFAEKNQEGTATFYYMPLFLSAVSLGDYIILDPVYRNGHARTKRHEQGHQKQSKILGPLYLLAVGLPSIVRNIYDRLAHRKWNSYRRENWYYSGYPERWADRLGGIY
jgi:hypothetical protein